MLYDACLREVVPVFWVVVVIGDSPLDHRARPSDQLVATGDLLLSKGKDCDVNIVRKNDYVTLL
jgi:hypothetical protein